MLVANRRWLIPLAVLGGALLYRGIRRGTFEQLVANVRAFDLPSAGLYDTLFAALLGGFYDRVADEVAMTCPVGHMLEVGSGPGRLAVRLAQTAPYSTLTGVDISPAMVDLASRRVAEDGLAERVRFQVGDVGALPFPDDQFDCVVSTLSLHHWPDPGRGLAEIHRLLKPGGEAWIYDLADWIWRAAHSKDGLAHLATVSPFGGGNVEVVRWPGNVPAFSRMRLRRAGDKTR